MKDNFLKYELDKIRNQIFDFGLIIASILGLITYCLSLVKINEIGFQVSYITDFIVVFCIILITVFRKKINLTIKAYFILAGLFLVLFIDLLQYGLLSANKVVIVLIPFFALVVFTLKRAVVVFGIAVIGFILVGYLIITNNNPMLNQGPPNLTHINSWLINFFILLIVASLILIASHRFNRAYTKILNDVEERNKAIAESERNYREIFNASTDAIFIHGMDGSVIDVNSSMLKMYGYKEEESDSLKFENLIEGVAPYDMENAGKHIQKAIETGEHVFDWRARKKDGTLIWVEVALKKTNIGGKNRVIAAVRDIDEKKQFTIQLEKYKNQLEELVKERTDELETTNKELKLTNKELIQQKEELSITINKLKETQEQLIQQEKMASLGVLTSGVGHEINNPLNFIQAGIYSIESYFEENADHDTFSDNRDRIVKIKDQMQIGVDRVSHIVKGLSHFSRQSKSLNEVCDIHQVIDNCLLILYTQYKNTTKIEKIYNSEKNKVTGNEGKLHQVFMNILVNAIHAIEKKGQISISTSVAGKSLSISIKDTGVGISKRNLSKIYDPFFSTKEAGKGTGLGLSIVYGILEEHLGSIKIKSKQDVGTEVIILLPLQS